MLANFLDRASNVLAGVGAGQGPEYADERIGVLQHLLVDDSLGAVAECRDRTSFPVDRKEND